MIESDIIKIVDRRNSAMDFSIILISPKSILPVLSLAYDVTMWAYKLIYYIPTYFCFILQIKFIHAYQYVFFLILILTVLSFSHIYSHGFYISDSFQSTTTTQLLSNI